MVPNTLATDPPGRPGRAPDGVHGHHREPVLREAGYSYQRTRTWCPTGTAARKRKAGTVTVTVTDPDAGPKKS